MLSGVAAMQKVSFKSLKKRKPTTAAFFKNPTLLLQSCGSAGAVANFGVVNYLAPVPCDRFFSFDWFILFWHFFVWLLVAIFLFSKTFHTARSMLTSLLATAATLLIFAANTWYRVNGAGSGLSGTFKTRARVTLSGAAIAAAADILMLMALGLHDERETDRSDDKRGGGALPTATTTTATTTETYRATTAEPVGTAGTTTAAARLGTSAV